MLTLAPMPISIDLDGVDSENIINLALTLLDNDNITPAAAELKSEAELKAIINNAINSNWDNKSSKIPEIFKLNKGVLDLKNIPSIPLEDVKSQADQQKLLTQQQTSLDIAPSLLSPPPITALKTATTVTTATVIASEEKSEKGDDKDEEFKDIGDKIYHQIKSEVAEKNQQIAAQIEAQCKNKQLPERKKILSKHRKDYCEWLGEFVEQTWEKFIKIIDHLGLIGTGKTSALGYDNEIIGHVARSMQKIFSLSVAIPCIEKSSTSLLTDAKQKKLISISKQYQLQFSVFYEYVKIDRKIATPQEMEKLRQEVEDKVDSEERKKGFNKGLVKSIKKLFETFHTYLIDESSSSFGNSSSSKKRKLTTSTAKKGNKTKKRKANESSEEEEEDSISQDDDDDIIEEYSDEEIKKPAKSKKRAKKNE